MKSQDEVYLEKCQRAGCDVLHLCQRLQLPLTAIIVYGSLARGLLGMGSDIDLMLLMDADAKAITVIRKQVMSLIPEYFEDEFPYIDLRIAREEAYRHLEDSEYGVYMTNVRRDGIVLWPK